jgi:hypothetical protein
MGVALSSSAVAEGTDTSSGYSLGTLSTADADGADTHAYSIVGGADAARFSVSGNQLVLSDGRLAVSRQGSYQVVVRSTDSGGASFDQAFTITVSPGPAAPAPEPVVVLPPQLPAPTSLPAAVVQQPAPAPDSNAQSTTDAADSADGDSEDNALPLPTGEDTTDASDLERSEAADALSRRAGKGVRVAFIAVAAGGSPASSGGGLRESAGTPESPLPADTMLAGAASSAAIPLEQFEASLTDASWRDAVDQMRERFDKPLRVEQMLIASSVTVGGGLSVGYIVWLLRGGLLVSSLLSSLPAWQSIDPLPVLGKREEDEGDGQDDSDPLERLFGRARDAVLSGIAGRRHAPPDATGTRQHVASHLPLVPGEASR